MSLALDIPELNTERLRLRGFRRQDFAAFKSHVTDPERMKHVYGGPDDENSAWDHFTSLVGEWVLNGFGTFAIEEKASGQVAGYSGLWQTPAIKEPELLWSLFAGFEGKGYATEAARAVQNWAANTLRLPPLMSFVDPDNAPSVKVAERLGAKVYAETILNGHKRLCFRHIVPEFET